MWNILKAEFEYSKTFLFVLGAVAIFFTVFEAIDAADLSTPCILNSIIALTLTSNIIITMNRERRFRHYVSLPVSLSKIAFVRILLAFIPCLFICFLFLGNYLYIKHTGSVRNSMNAENTFLFLALLFYGVIIIGFLLHFILNDLTVSYKEFFSRRISIGVILVFLIFGIIIIQKSISYYTYRISGDKIIEFIRTYSPFADEYNGVHKIALLALLFSVISIFTFIRRKTYLE